MSSQSKTKRRYNTVHDLASLRLHPDGSRVATEPSTTVQPSTTLYARSVRHAVKDARGNWIARDAAGLGKVKKRKRVDEDLTEERETIDIRIGEGGENGEGEGEGSGDKLETGKKAKTARGMKRIRFQEDLGLLEGGLPETVETVPDDGPSTLPTPSSDLLKCVHYFASHYYAARGVLLDNGREYRKEKKARKEQRDKEKRGSVEEGAEDSEDEEDEILDRSRAGGHEDEDEFDDGEEDFEDDEKASAKRERRRGKAKERKEPERDMYRAFDGSALMAISMLLQEHVSQLLAPNIPPGWEEGMAAEGKIVDSDSDVDAKPGDLEDGGNNEEGEESSDSSASEESE